MVLKQIKIDNESVYLFFKTFSFFYENKAGEVVPHNFLVLLHGEDSKFESLKYEINIFFKNVLKKYNFLYDSIEFEDNINFELFFKNLKIFLKYKNIKEKFYFIKKNIDENKELDNDNLIFNFANKIYKEIYYKYSKYKNNKEKILFFTEEDYDFIIKLLRRINVLFFCKKGTSNLIEISNKFIEDKKEIDYSDIKKVISIDVTEQLSDEALCIIHNNKAQIWTPEKSIRRVKYLEMFSPYKLFVDGRVTIFGGGSGIGKSLLLTHIGASFFISNKYKYDKREMIFHFIYENTKDEVMSRFFANVFYQKFNLNYTIDDVADCKYRKTDMDKIKNLMEETGRFYMVVKNYDKRHTVEDIENIINITCEKYNVVPYIILIDYIDMLVPQEKTGKEYIDIGNISFELLNFADRLNVPIVTVTHINRAGYEVEDISDFSPSHVGKSLRKWEHLDVCSYLLGMRENGKDILYMKIDKHRYSKIYGDGLLKFEAKKEYSYFVPCKKKNTNEIAGGLLDNSVFDDF